MLVCGNGDDGTACLVALGVVIFLNTKKVWPGIIKDPGCFDESPLIPNYGETKFARECKKEKQAIMKQDLADGDIVIGGMVNNMRDAEILG